jgi:hypothetical protein
LRKQAAGQTGGELVKRISLKKLTDEQVKITAGIGKKEKSIVIDSKTLVTFLTELNDVNEMVIYSELPKEEDNKTGGEAL